MPLYSFVCKICQKEKDFTLKVSDACLTGETMEIKDLAEDPILCSSCQGGRWQRVWKLSAPAFRMNMRKTSI